ncbi:hypothetical protein P168DRAFT_323311 [Aspergillus campestris IBT 28561]|uniref:Uncharacterized protein n=1 Tax=Aspergillus campestris (strain IBT 28561) TaxID=1392248 RepID=A0A2I1DE24_ASPC2|nr:uncharacterized protein P168DRAFT_323311 [Aspergillus campestris IBT 28561]PKY08125.1 hypothetical protein P168DRAFT_323311 [Aspergillus campestris IBT 28561]
MYHTFSPSPVKEGRRILGEKTPNACLSPAHHRHASASPVKSQLTTSPRKLLPSPSFAGQKRSIDQVDHDQTRVNKHGVLSPRKEAPRGHASQTGTQTLSTVPEDIQLSQEPRPDALNPETSQPQQEQSSSQTTELAEPVSPETTVPEDPSTRKSFIQQKANLLRSRIQNAMRHVHDPQFDRRLSELEAHSRKYPRLSRPDLLETPTQRKFTPHLSNDTATPSSAAPPRALQPALELHPGLSSPPLSAGAAYLPDPLRTPTQKHHPRQGAHSPMQLSSPPASASRRRHVDRGLNPDQTEESREDGERQQSTPPQKGEGDGDGDAVDGLLKLMNTADQHGSPAA